MVNKVSNNLEGYLILKKLTNLEGRTLKMKLRKRLLNLIREFDDTEVASNYLIEFLEKKDINVSIFDRVFNTFNFKNIDYTALSVALSYEAAEFINKRNPQSSLCKNQKDFEAYFKSIFDVLLEIRVSILSLDGRGLAFTISDFINKAEKVQLSQ